QKMSKSLRNYPDVSEVFDRDGADAMRWFLMSSSVIRGGNLVVTEEGIREGVRQFLLPLWNSYYFFTLYANAADPTSYSGYSATWRTDSTNVLDRYLLAKTRQLIGDVTSDLEALDSPMAAAKLRDFADVLTNWYVRRSRDRFWAGDDRDAFDTLFTVLETVTRVAAPLIPLVSEEVWKGLTGGRSVHLQDWPDQELFPANDVLADTMDRVREIASAGLALRKSTGLRVRLPLARLTIVSEDGARLQEFSDILGDELNVKQVEFTALAEDSLPRFGIVRKLSVNARAAGPRIGKAVQQVIKAAREGFWEQTGDTVTVDGIELLPAEFDLELTAGDNSSAITFLPGGGFVLLDTETTPELEAEGLARDLVRAVQETRRSAGFQVSDRIRLSLVFENGADASGVAGFQTLLGDETLATEVIIASGVAAETMTPAGGFRSQVPAGQYANSGGVTIDVAVVGAGINV
ncbi:MAG TPA: class I tRNA ligase family protein, partial [Homoserinimonas sp.]|nr:class I tRNA ligase family protein [Homoserinimonas sp.]